MFKVGDIVFYGVLYFSKQWHVFHSIGKVEEKRETSVTIMVADDTCLPKELEGKRVFVIPHWYVNCVFDPNDEYEDFALTGYSVEAKLYDKVFKTIEDGRVYRALDIDLRFSRHGGYICLPKVPFNSSHPAMLEPTFSENAVTFCPDTDVVIIAPRGTGMPETKEEAQAIIRDDIVQSLGRVPLNNRRPLRQLEVISNTVKEHYVFTKNNQYIDKRLCEGALFFDGTSATLTCGEDERYPTWADDAKPHRWIMITESFTHHLDGKRKYCWYMLSERFSALLHLVVYGRYKKRLLKDDEVARFYLDPLNSSNDKLREHFFWWV
jgi:hypothetical protein